MPKWKVCKGCQFSKGNFNLTNELHWTAYSNLLNMTVEKTRQTTWNSNTWILLFVMTDFYVSYDIWIYVITQINWTIRDQHVIPCYSCSKHELIQWTRFCGFHTSKCVISLFFLLCVLQHTCANGNNHGKWYSVCLSGWFHIRCVAQCTWWSCSELHNGGLHPHVRVKGAAI